MVTVLAAHQFPRGYPPSGSIILDELLRRYLVFIALQRFRALSLQEIKQYALLAVYRVVEKHGLEGIGVDEFWEWVKPGELYSRTRLLPDTAVGHAYHADQVARRKEEDEGEETVILRTIDNVKTFTRKVFINLILEDLRAEAKQQGLKNAAMEESAPSARRGSLSDEGHQSLDEILRHLREDREGAELDAARFVLRRVREKMSEQQRLILDLLFDGYTPRRVADVLGVEVSYVYGTRRVHRAACMTLWVRLFGNH